MVKNKTCAAVPAPTVSAQQGSDLPPNHHYQYDETLEKALVEKLYFTNIDERLTTLEAPQGTTCRWFLEKPEYISWYGAHQQGRHGVFLWIKGHPGTGKSTLMKFLFEDAKLKAKGDPSKITLSFFFIARGTLEQRSTAGLYRSILYQLFQTTIDLQKSFDWLTIDGAKAIQRNGWSEAALKQTLINAVSRLKGRQLMIFVDALDECDQTQAAGMVSFFEELCALACEMQAQVHVCFSSRHYPTISIREGVEVILEDETGHIQDIEQYIKSKLRLHESHQSDLLRFEILERSSGIFLWVVLVLDILNSEYPNCSVSIQKIRRRLQELPKGLSNLFEMILFRDDKNLEQMRLCLRWILWASHPLEPQELYFAVQVTLDEDCSGVWNRTEVTSGQIETFVRTSSKGLAEVTKNIHRRVQFIHEAVRDFLLGELESKWSGISGDTCGRSHQLF
ncbi:hypothetical protein GQ53DRAFT_660648, partial [Thozetella sp. PMI_491]